MCPSRPFLNIGVCAVVVLGSIFLTPGVGRSQKYRVFFPPRPVPAPLNNSGSATGTAGRAVGVPAGTGAFTPFSSSSASAGNNGPSMLAGFQGGNFTGMGSTGMGTGFPGTFGGGGLNGFGSGYPQGFGSGFPGGFGNSFPSGFGGPGSGFPGMYGGSFSGGFGPGAFGSGYPVGMPGGFGGGFPGGMPMGLGGFPFGY